MPEENKAEEEATNEETVETETVETETDFTALDAEAIKDIYETIRAERVLLQDKIDAKKTLGERVPVASYNKLRELTERGNEAVKAYTEALKPVGTLSQLPEDTQRDPGKPNQTETTEPPAKTPEETVEEVIEETTEAPAEAPAEETEAAPAEETEAAPAETPTEVPAETVQEIEAIEEKVLVTAKAPVAPVPAGSATQRIPFDAAGPNDSRIRTARDLQQAFMNAASGPKREQMLASFVPYGTDEKRRLTSNPLENYRTMYGRDGIATGETPTERVRRASFGGQAPDRMSFTAALNCAGPAQPVMDIPFCFNDNRPLADSGLIAEFEAVHGQVQLYDCAALPAPITLEPAPDCGEETPCGECPPLTGCYELSCLEPAEPIEPDRYVTCMCVPESIRWSNPLAFEHALISFAAAHAQAWELEHLAAIRATSIVRTVDGTIRPAHSAFNTIKRGIIAALAQKRLGARAACDLGNYSIFIPGGEELFFASMADRMSRVLGCECPGEDLLDELQSLVGGGVIFGEDRDPASPATAAFPYVWDPTTVELGTPAPLEDIPNAGSVYLIPRDSLGTATLPTVELGLDNRDKCEVHTGCLKMVRSEWRLPIFRVGCDVPVVLDFTDLCLEGTGPALTDPTCP